MPAPLNANELCLSTPTWRVLSATRHSREMMLAVACANVMVDVYIYVYIAMPNQIRTN